MKNRKFTKVAIIVLAMVLVCIASIAGTVAYLTSKSAVVTNTFTVGNVTITLDEAPVDENGQATTGDRVIENEYKLIPGVTYDKDPTVHVAAGSEDCWLFVKVDNGIAAIEADTKIADQMATIGWTLVDGETNIYAYKDTVSAGEDVVVFNTFTVDANADNNTVAAYNAEEIVVQALAIQATGFNTAAAAFAANGWPA